ncbi:concanavalin A-like lectin/glucanase domain-containing protein [Xylogone sp. PMI_703]|nr:concanavalin A-like lectin/glucanase domain-containing protein [Xylogone sp. PMI_703]
MKFTATAVLAALLSAEAALASAPSARSLARRQARREARETRRTHFRHLNESAHATVQSNWGGAIIETSGVTAVSATANVPRGSGGSSAAGTAWVGIDGANCQSAILQTGFDWYGDGTYDAWYEWYPEFSDNFSGISIAEGDEITMSVVATSRNSGSATLQNLSTGQKVTKNFSGVTAGNLCQTDAEFIIEDFEECNSSGSNCQFVPFSSFTPAIKFTGATTTANGRNVPLSQAEITEVIINNRDATSCSISGSTLTCASG